MRESCSQAVADRYVKEREKLRLQLSVALKSSMAKLVGNDKYSDVLLKSSDGVQIPAHLCILKNRSPGFFRCYIEHAIGKSGANRSQIPIVDIPDADSNSLQFFLKCVYTEEEAPIDVQEAFEKYSGRGPDEDEDRTEESHMESDEPKQQLVKSTDSTTSNQTFILNRSTSGAGMSSMAQQGSDNEQPQSISEVTESTVIEANMLLSPESQPFDSEDVSPDTLALDLESEEDVRKRPRLQANSTVPHMISFANLKTAGSEEHEEAVAPISSRSLVMNEDNLSDSMDEESSAEDQAQQRSHEDGSAKQSEARGEMKRSSSRGDEKIMAQFIPLSDPDGGIGAAFEDAGVIDESKKMFSMFIEIERKRMPGLRKADSGEDSTKETVSERLGSGRKRWSTVSSIDRISLGSQDLIAHDSSIADDSMSLGGFSVDESGNVNFDDSDQTACSKLGHDLLRLFLDQLDCDIQVLVDDKSIVEIQK